jgi:hypothetical protein
MYARCVRLVAVDLIHRECQAWRGRVCSVLGRTLPAPSFQRRKEGAGKGHQTCVVNVHHCDSIVSSVRGSVHARRARDMRDLLLALALATARFVRHDISAKRYVWGSSNVACVCNMDRMRA